MRGYRVVSIATIILVAIALGCSSQMATTKPDMREEMLKQPVEADTKEETKAAYARKMARAKLQEQEAMSQEERDRQIMLAEADTLKDGVSILVRPFRNSAQDTVVDALAESAPKAIAAYLAEKGVRFLGNQSGVASRDLLLSIYHREGHIQIYARLIDAVRAKVIAKEEAIGTPDESPELVDQIARSIWSQLATGGSEDPVSERKGE